MLLPNGFREQFARRFYDKEITVYENRKVIDARGGLTFDQTAKGTFKGNVRFTNLGELQTELGLTENIDIVITCPTDTAVEIDNLLQYADVKYVAVDVVPSDSHLTIVGQKWQATS